MRKTLSDKQKLFCAYYCATRDGTEAAAKAGYSTPKKAGARLLEREDVRANIADIDKTAKINFADVLSGYRRLAFGGSADAISLLFDDDVTREKLESMDLYNIAEIKRVKDGVIQIRFFDRLKAMEKLGSFTKTSQDKGMSALYDAIKEGARAISGVESPL